MDRHLPCSGSGSQRNEGKRTILKNAVKPAEIGFDRVCYPVGGNIEFQCGCGAKASIECRLGRRTAHFRKPSLREHVHLYILHDCVGNRAIRSVQAQNQ